MRVLITDYVKEPDIEADVLGPDLANAPSAEIEALLVWHQQIDADYIAQFPNLKGVVRYGVGYDAIDLALLEEKGITFCNTPDYGTDEVSDTAVAMIMNIARGISQYDVACRNYTDGTWQENTLGHIRRNADMTIGVIGAGRIGGSACIKLRAIGYNVVFFDPYRDRGYEKMLGVGRCDSLEELLGISDIVSIHTPLNAQTRNIIDKAFINKMKPGSSIVNTARGELLADLSDLHDALKSGHMRCAALDVLPDEPPSMDHELIQAWHKRESWLDGRFIINPHSAYFSDRAYFEMRQKAALNAKRILEGETPFNIITKG